MIHQSTSCKHILQLALSLGVILMVFCKLVPADEVNDKNILRIAGWDVYADPQHSNKTIGYRSFEKKFNARIEFTPLSNLESIIEAAESDSNFDLFIISNEGVKPLFQMGLAQPLDLSKIPHYRELHHNLKYNEWSQFNANAYAVPWAWGPTGLLYDTTVMSEPDSWNILWDPKYIGKVTLWDDISMIWTTALSLGYTNVFNLTQKQLAKVKEKLLQFNERAHQYYSGNDDMLNALKEHDVILLNSWFDPSKRLKKNNRHFKMVIPREGAVGMFDSYLISSQTNKTLLAYHFINHQISPAIQKEMIEVTGLSPANIETIALLTTEEIKALHLDEIDYFNRMILWDVMPRKHLYQKILDEVRTDFQSRIKQ